MNYSSTFSFSKASIPSYLFRYLRFSFLQIVFAMVFGGFLAPQLLAQTPVEVGTYDLRFEEFVPGCGSTNVDYCVQMQIKSASDVESFSIGSYTFYFTFNNNSISNPTYQSINFNHTNVCAGGNAAYMEPAFFADNFTGEANVTAIMELPNQGCPTVGSNWRSIGLVCFEIVDDTESTQLAFGADFTEVNKNDDTPRHNQGTFNELDILPTVTNSPANVELVPNAPTMVELCSDEGLSLVADVTTLSFGPGVGENPVVGWGISTTNPGDASPLLAEGYTDIVLAGNPTTTITTIEGTVDGLDPYELGVSTIWVSPITFVDYDAEAQAFTLDFECFDWGTAVQIDFLANGIGDCPTDCTANVDLSDQIEDISLCSDESVMLLADVNTVDFGNDAGDNPVVGWAIITGVAAEGNPFDDPNYTGGLIAGDATTTGITITGTSNGLDPFGFNVDAISFVPITFINFDSNATPPLFLDQDCFDWGEAVTVSFLADGEGDCPPPCDANVEVADNLELTVALCVEENHELSVNAATLDLGVNEGDNPVVGWVISTSNPGDGSPFEGEGFTGAAIPGNGANFATTVIGTSSGLDPYDFGVSMLWFTPVTYIHFDEGTNNFTLDDNCFDWGETVQIQFLAESEDACNPLPQCPTMVGDFSASEDVCDGDRPTVPNDETILNSLDDATNAVIVWSTDPSAPLVYSGDGCEPQTVELTLTILCSEDESVSIEAGTFSVTIYPIPEAPSIVFSNPEICSYTVVPNCPNDMVTPSIISDQNPGTTGATESFTVANEGCSELTFDNVPVPDCPEIVPICPSSIGDFNGSESICEMGLANVPSDGDILASLDDPTNAIIEWSINPIVPLVYEGDGCTPQRLDFELRIRCSDNLDIVLNGGTHTVFLYPSPQAPTVNLISATEVCRYELIPNCENDIMDPAVIEDQVAGSGELVQIIKVTNEACTGLTFFDVTIPACPAICPTSAGVFNTTESLCDGDSPNVPSDETILSSVDLAERATINWFPNPSDPLIYSGDGCNAQAVIFNLTIGCQVDGSVEIAGGTHIVNLYPAPQAPMVDLVENADGVCSYVVVPVCQNDVVTPSTISDLPAGSMDITLPFNVSNEGCGEMLFPAIEVPDCILDDIDPINLPNLLQMDIRPNFLQKGNTSHIEVYLPKSGLTLLEVLDISGRRVKTLQQGELQNGVHEFEWDVETISSGLYFVRMQTEYGQQVRKVVVE